MKSKVICVCLSVGSSNSSGSGTHRYNGDSGLSTHVETSDTGVTSGGGDISNNNEFNKRHPAKKAIQASKQSSAAAKINSPVKSK